MKVISKQPLSEDVLQKIESIFRESNCPNESLSKTFENYSGMMGVVIFFDGVTFGDYARGEAVISDVGQDYCLIGRSA